MTSRTPRQRGMVVEKFEHMKFNAEIRFDKNSGQFLAKAPPDESFADPTLAGIKAKLVKYAHQLKNMGGWKKMLMVSFDKRGEVEHHGGLGRYESRGLSLGFLIYEEREHPPEGKRIVRAWKPEKERKEDLRFFGTNSEDEGDDQAWRLNGLTTMEWTAEREKVLTAIQTAMGELGERLEKVVQKPELAAGGIQRLLSGGDK